MTDWLISVQDRVIVVSADHCWIDRSLGKGFARRETRTATSRLGRRRIQNRVRQM